MKYVRNFDSFRENRKSEQQFNEELDLKAGLQKLGQKLTAGVNWIKGKIQSFANSFSKMKGKAKLAAIEALLPSEVVKDVYDQVKKVNPKAMPVKNESFLLESLLLEERTSATGEVVSLAPDVKKLKEAAEQAKIKLRSVEGLKDKSFTEQEMKDLQEVIQGAIKAGKINQSDIDAINEYHNLLIKISKGTKFERGFMKGGKIGDKWKDISREDFDSDKEYQQALDRIKQAQSQGQGQDEEEVQVKEEEEDTGIGKQPEWAKEIAQACAEEGISVEVEMIPKLQPSMKGVHTKIDNMKIPDGAKKTIKILSTILFFGILFLKGTSGMAATAGHAPGDDHKFMGDDGHDGHKDVKDVKGGEEPTKVTDVKVAGTDKTIELKNIKNQIESKKYYNEDDAKADGEKDIKEDIFGTLQVKIPELQNLSKADFENVKNSIKISDYGSTKVVKDIDGKYSLKFIKKGYDPDAPKVDYSKGKKVVVYDFKTDGAKKTNLEFSKYMSKFIKDVKGKTTGELTYGEYKDVLGKIINGELDKELKGDGATGVKNFMKSVDKQDVKQFQSELKEKTGSKTYQYGKGDKHEFEDGSFGPATAKARVSGMLADLESMAKNKIKAGEKFGDESKMSDVFKAAEKAKQSHEAGKKGQLDEEGYKVKSVDAEMNKIQSAENIKVGTKGK